MIPVRLFERVRRERNQLRCDLAHARLRAQILLNERDEARADADALALMVPVSERETALALVRTRHDIARLKVVDE